VLSTLAIATKKQAQRKVCRLGFFSCHRTSPNVSLPIFKKHFESGDCPFIVFVMSNGNVRQIHSCKRFYTDDVVVDLTSSSNYSYQIGLTLLLSMVENLKIFKYHIA